MAEVTTRALKAVWYQKWRVHLRLRPEEGAGLLDIHLRSNGDVLPQAVPNLNILTHSAGVQASFGQYNNYLLPQAFPEGSPAHPSYPTGHGTQTGASITVLKFFFDGNFVISNPVMPTSDGTSLVGYTPPTGEAPLTICGELNKLSRNVTFGHGILAGIHYRSDSEQSMLLGEAIALSVLQDRAKGYNEPFTVSLKKLDGSTATVSNLPTT